MKLILIFFCFAVLLAEGSQSGVWWASFFVGYGRGYPPMLRKERENAHKHTPHQRFPSLMEEIDWNGVKSMESNQWSERNEFAFLSFSFVFCEARARSKKNNKKKKWKEGGTPKRSQINQTKGRRAAQRNFLLWGLWGGAHLRERTHSNNSSIVFVCLSCSALLLCCNARKETSSRLN